MVHVPVLQYTSMLLQITEGDTAIGVGDDVVGDDVVGMLVVS